MKKGEAARAASIVGKMTRAIAYRPSFSVIRI
jgi:hypothetical protein